MGAAIDGPSIDVIVPLHNKAAFVEQALRSVLTQSLPVGAVYVADDASSDDGREIVRRLALEDARIMLIESPFGAASGPSATRNRAIRAGRGEFVAMLDADDWWEDGKLAAQIPAFGDPATGLSHCLYRWVDVSGAPMPQRPTHLVPTYTGRLVDAARLGEYAVTGSASAVVLRRSLLPQAGLFPEQLRFGEDWALWANIAAIANFSCVPKPLVNIRWVEGTLQRQLDAGDRFLENLKVWSLWENDPDFVAMAVPVLRRHLALAQLRLLLDPQRLLVQLPRQLREQDSGLARSLLEPPGSYYANLARMLPVAMGKLVDTARRARQ